MINKWNLPRETTQMACPISFQNKKPSRNERRISNLSPDGSMKRFALWVLLDIGEGACVPQFPCQTVVLQAVVVLQSLRVSCHATIAPF